MVVCLPSVDAALGLILKTLIELDVLYTCNHSILRWRQEGRKFKASLCYMKQTNKAKNPERRKKKILMENRKKAAHKQPTPGAREKLV